LKRLFLKENNKSTKYISITPVVQVLIKLESTIKRRLGVRFGLKDEYKDLNVTTPKNNNGESEFLFGDNLS